MPGRATTLASAVFATVLAGTDLMCTGSAPAEAAEDCLRAPSQDAPAGAHWYYRSDRQNHRKCWYRTDGAHKSDRTAPARSPGFAGKNLPRNASNNSPNMTERMSRSYADARAELLELPYAEPFMDGPLRISPEEPVPRRGNILLNSTPTGDRVPATANVAADAPVHTAPQAVQIAAGREAAVQLAANEATEPTSRLTLSLVLMAMGFAAVASAVVFRRSDPDPVSARLNRDPFRMRYPVEESEEAAEEMISDERASLALAEDIPLFLVHGRLGPG